MKAPLPYLGDAIDELDQMDDLLQAVLLLITGHVEPAYQGPLSAVLSEAQLHLPIARRVIEAHLQQ